MAGLFGFGDYTKPGKGIDKDAPKKRSIFLFFELIGRKFSKLIGLNFLYLITIIPTFIVVFLLSGFISSYIVDTFSPIMAELSGLTQEGALVNEEFMHLTIYFDLIIRTLISVLFTILWGMGPVTAGFTYVLRNYAREEHAWLVSDFFSYTKTNFKQSIIVWLIDIVMFFVLFNAYRFYAVQNGVLSIMKYFILSIAIVYTMMHFYIYQIMITFELPLKQIYRNSFILALGKLPRNVLILISLLFVSLVLPVISIYSSNFIVCILIYVAVLILILFSLSGFLTNFFIYPVIKKEMLSKVDPEKYSNN